MNDKEYEISFKVKSLQPFINYCAENNYKLVEHCEQERTIYRNANKTMARITINIAGGAVKKQLDFKEDNYVKGAIVKELNESKAIAFTDDEAVASVLEFLQYKKDNTIKRTRYTFEQGDVRFELDNNTFPTTAQVVSIEGNKQKVDQLYQAIKVLG